MRFIRPWILVVSLLTGVSVPVSAQYSGPSMLSRGGNTPGRRGAAPVDFTSYVTGNGRYETGLVRPSVTPNGELETVDSKGGGVEYGVYGGHDWQRQSVGLDYRGDYHYDTPNIGYNGTNQALAFEYSRLLSRRLTMVFQETGGTTNRAFGSFVAPAFADVNRIGVPLNELFDVRMYYSQTAVSVGWRKSARTSVAFGGQAFFIKRQSDALTNSQGYAGVASYNYRVTRRTTIGLEYQYFHFEYPHVLSNSTANTFGFRYRRAISKSVNVDASVGLYHLDSTGTEVVQLSPAVAAILGRTTGNAAFRRSSNNPAMDGTVSYLLDRGRVYLNVQTGVGAGNGVYLATTRTTANTGYSYTGIRKASIGVSAGWSRISSASLDLQAFNTWQAGGGGAYKLRPHVNATFQIDYRTFGGSNITGRHGYVATVGIGYVSSTIPLSIW